ncbi:hypothetical protein [Wolbachia endosymbiont of Tetranychus urticae]|uniref:hypothetical protein n=1 Tax=Wolbachia endosymbiont of Tetranychus urticae TaxID=169184 RepID=UPI003978AA21
MKEYNYKNLADESNFGSQVYRTGMFDKILGISKTAKEAANQVIPIPTMQRTDRQ